MPGRTPSECENRFRTSDPCSAKSTGGNHQDRVLRYIEVYVYGGCEKALVPIIPAYVLVFLKRFRFGIEGLGLCVCQI